MKRSLVTAPATASLCASHPYSGRSAPQVVRPRLTLLARNRSQVFGGKFTEENGFGDGPELEEKPRQHFDYIGPAMISVFVAMIGDWVRPRPTAAPGLRRAELSPYRTSPVVPTLYVCCLSCRWISTR